MARFKMDKSYVHFKERVKIYSSEKLNKALKQYFVVKVGDANGAEHGEDYEEMKQTILDTLFTDKEF